ncbi:type IX secretion system membrane protein PorP/SprF [Parabacteroides sp. OttesenSCG-928-G07]|nr:type IX secretion system membrane protein PorP/SprF [Parabacteroides sp. OttesenSCG-928-G21]MDL2277957.1 type IX secretion system membrane protein PorP/SprF [Parabacteroides sp. OttesenSCG-928-G07]
MKRLLFLLILLIMTCTEVVRAQYDAQLSNYFMSMGYYNPAYAGTTDYLNVFALHRQQWIGIDRAPKSFFVSADMPLSFGNSTHGVGVVFFQESAGLYNNMHIAGQYAYKKALWGGTLSIGVQAGIANMIFDGGKSYIPPGDYYAGVDMDGSIPSTEVEGMALDLNAGAFFTHPKFYVGLGVMHLAEPEIQLDENLYSYIGRMVNFTAGYNIQTRNPLYELQPSVFLKTDMISFQADLTARLVYNKMFNGGLTWRPGQSVVLLLGGTFGSFQVGYAYDFPTSPILKETSGSHEVMVKYRLTLKKTKTGKNRHKSVRIL